MEPRGTLFIVDEMTADELLELEGDAAVVAAVQAELAEYADQGSHEPVFELGLNWDAIQRCLAAGQSEGDDSPLERAIVGGQQLHSEPQVVVSFKSPEQVKAVAREIDWITETEFQEAVEQLEADDSAPDLPGSWEHLWDIFSGLVEFYHFASKQGLGVVFTTARALAPPR